MTDVEVLRIALEKEERSIKFYQGMLAEHPNLMDMLQGLIIAEQNHKKIIEKKISALTK